MDLMYVSDSEDQSCIHRGLVVHAVSVLTPAYVVQ